ncbi:hypothetical protein [Xanthomonas arboricola]|uniref:hypothetical protein n=1 Tax=Xanthomonas arboricola TaxID=56448 RepID=UPI00141BECC3|nr:hypothetical protein [Xanthomonas arboricola]
MDNLVEPWNAPRVLQDLPIELKLYRGFRTHDSTPEIYISSPVNRIPVDVPPQIQIIVDDYFDEIFGIRFRQRGIFCSGNIKTAREYAHSECDIRSISSIYNFAFCWSPKVKDFYEHLPEFDGTKKTIHEFLKNSRFMTTDLEMAITSGNEIILVGDEFLARSISE